MASVERKVFRECGALPALLVNEVASLIQACRVMAEGVAARRGRSTGDMEIRKHFLEILRVTAGARAILQAVPEVQNTPTRPEQLRG